MNYLSQKLISLTIILSAITIPLAMLAHINQVQALPLTPPLTPPTTPTPTIKPLPTKIPRPIPTVICRPCPRGTKCLQSCSVKTLHLF